STTFPILFAYHIAKQASICETPFYLVYGKKAKLPMHPSEPPDLLNEAIIQRMYEIDHDLPEALTQERQKEQHDRPILPEPEFAIGVKVLLYNSRVMGTYSHKFVPKWKGPYYIHDNLSRGAYKLRELGEKVLTVPKIQYDQYVLNPIDVDPAPCPFSIEQMIKLQPLPFTTSCYEPFAWATELKVWTRCGTIVPHLHHLAGENCEKH
ncbi:1532_t:CDS:2, partial [Gigaspora rosea]